jgi:hypothetical protein
MVVPGSTDMVQKPGRSAHSLDVASLLDLLNNSEGELNETEPVAEEPVIVPASIEVSSVAQVASPKAENADFSSNVPENTDNRFAAHIVYGLSKLKRT